MVFEHSDVAGHAPKAVYWLAATSSGSEGIKGQTP